MYKLLESPTEFSDRLRQLVADWTMVVPYELSRIDGHTNKRKIKPATSFEERVFLADVAFFLSRPTEKLGEYEPVELVVPQFATLSLFKKVAYKNNGVSCGAHPLLDTWDPDKVIAKLEEDKHEAAKRKGRSFPRSDANQTRICLIKFRIAAVDTLITVFDDGAIRHQQLSSPGCNVAV